MHALLISALSLPPRHISDGLPPRQLSEITCDTQLSCNAARHFLACDEWCYQLKNDEATCNRAYKICDPLVDPGGPLDCPGGDPGPRPCSLFLVWIGVIEHSNPKIQFGYVAKESRKPSIFQGVWHRKETFIQPGLEETTLQRTESQRM